MLQLGFGLSPLNSGLLTMAMAMAMALGVVAGAALVGLTHHLRGGTGDTLGAGEFPPAYIAIGLMTLISFFAFLRLPADVGDEMRGRARRGEGWQDVGIDSGLFCIRWRCWRWSLLTCCVLISANCANVRFWPILLKNSGGGDAV